MIGTWQLVRLALRRDRASLPAWVLVLGLLAAFTVATYEQLYPTAESRAPLTAMLGGNAAISVLYGPAYDLSTPGGFTAWRTLSFLSIFIGLMVVFTVTRHTRAEEDSGRHELVAAGVVGRFAPLTAAAVVAGGASLVIGAVNAIALAASGVPVAGALAFGAAAASVGLVFTGITAVAVQVAGHARSANGIACGVLGGTFLLRGLGDATQDARWLSWVSPIGWAHRVRPFTGEHWWALGLAVGATVVGLAAGYGLLTRRDAGSGLRVPRPGRSAASVLLRSPLALAWRLQRGALAGWSVGFAAAGLAFGSIALGVVELVGDNPQLRRIVEQFGGSDVLIDAFLAQIAGMFAMVAALYGVQAAVRMRSEEVAVRLEPLLAAAVSRWRWAAGHLAFAMVGAAVVLAVGGLAVGLAHGARVGDVGEQVSAMLGATMAQLPAVWVVVGIAVMLFGFLPRHTELAWAFALGFVILTLFGPVIGLPQVVLDASPFAHTPRLPGSDVVAGPLGWLAGIALAGLAAGLAGLRRRDIG